MGVWGNLSAVGMLAVIGMFVFTGLLVPRRVLQDMEKQRNDYREAYILLREKYDNRFDARLQVNTEALGLVQEIFAPKSDTQSKVD